MTDNSDVPIYDIETMQVLQRAQEFSCIEATPILVEFALPLQVVEKLSSIDCNHQSVSKFS